MFNIIYSYKQFPPKFGALSWNVVSTSCSPNVLKVKEFEPPTCVLWDGQIRPTELINASLCRIWPSPLILLSLLIFIWPLLFSVFLLCFSTIGTIVSFSAICYFWGGPLAVTQGGAASKYVHPGSREVVAELWAFRMHPSDFVGWDRTCVGVTTEPGCIPWTHSDSGCWQLN